jgi:hypothetical protein
MTINLSDPILGPVAIGIVLMIIGGTYHYVLTLIKLKVTDKKFSDVLSELDSLHKNYKAEIADIKTHHKDIMTRSISHVIDRYDKKIDEFIEHNKPSGNAFYIPKKSKKGIAEF